MKIVKGVLITLGILVTLVIVLFLISLLCKTFGWLPSITDWLNINIFEKLGLTFFSKIGAK